MLFYVTCTDSFAMVNKEGIGNNRFIFSLVSMQAVRKIREGTLSQLLSSEFVKSFT